MSRKQIRVHMRMCAKEWLRLHRAGEPMAYAMLQRAIACRNLSEECE